MDWLPHSLQAPCHCLSAPPRAPDAEKPRPAALTLLPVPPLVFTLRCLFQTSSGMYVFNHCLHSQLEGKVLCFIHLGKILLLRRPPVKTCWMDRQKIRGDGQYTNKHTHKWKRCTAPVFGRRRAVLPSLVGGGLPYAESSKKTPQSKRYWSGPLLLSLTPNKSCGPS